MRQRPSSLRHGGPFGCRRQRQLGIAVALVGAALLGRKALLLGRRLALRGSSKAPSERRSPEGTVLSPIQAHRLLADRTQRLEQTIAALEGFCYTIAHDLRAPLRAMEGFAQALLEEYGPKLDSTGIEYAQRISSSARRMDRMIQDLLDFEQLATVEPHSVVLELEPLIQEVLLLLAGEIRSRGAQVRVQRPLCAVHANRTLLKRVLSELVSNSLRFVAAGTQPSVRIWTERRGSSVLLSIQDNGIGIAREHQERVFEPFVRLYGQDTYTGTGIGLAIVKRSVETMGGTVTVQSTAGQGTRIEIELPAV